VSETVKCKGCLEEFPLPIEPKFAYKLNDLIKNNILRTEIQSDGKLSVVPDGNLTVIRTLVSMYRKSLYSFDYSPQINLFSNHSNKPCTDIDIVCLTDGELIIGEAKHTSAAFSADNNKSLKSLAEIAKAIRPDKIILSCYDNPKGRLSKGKLDDGKLEKAKQGLIHIFNKWEYQPEIETLHLYPPDDIHLDGYRYFLH
jgi:hypothetical protein